MLALPFFELQHLAEERQDVVLETVGDGAGMGAAVELEAVLDPEILHPDVQRFAASHPTEVRLIDAGGSVDSVVRQIASCAAITSSSLHGLVLADSFGIPASWFGLEPELWGGSFKFQDYESVVTPGRTRRATFHAESALSAVVASAALADAGCVARSIGELEESLEQVEARQLPPFLALRARRQG